MSIKLFILAVICILSGGITFSEYFRNNKFLSFLVTIIAIIATYYLFQDIYNDLKQPSLSSEVESSSPVPSPQSKFFKDRLKDGGLGPEMVKNPAGTFRMGSNDHDSEKPVHSVSVKAFMIGKYEVTFDEYDAFAEATGREKQNDRGWGRGNRPVINVSWDDAMAYVEWLSEQTGHHYRLPTEAEWEYTARAGTKTKYWWGNDIGENKANCDGCGSQFDNKMTASVGSFSANPFGLYDTVGNVWEWTCSVSESYGNGTEQRCASKNYNKNRVVRGGSWFNYPGGSRAAFRLGYSLDHSGDTLGFRIVWTL